MKKLAIVVLAVSAAAVAGCNKDKKEDTMASVSSAPTADAAAPSSDKTEVATGEVREALLALSRVHFEHDKAVLLPESRQALDEAGTRLKSYPEVEVYIDGHTDETGTGEYNLALGDKRAKIVSEYLQALGIAADRLHTVTFGEEKPLTTGSDEQAMAQNRRAEFRLFKGDVQLVLEESAAYPRPGTSTEANDDMGDDDMGDDDMGDDDTADDDTADE